MGLLCAVLQENNEDATAFHCKIVCFVQLSKFEEALSAMNRNQKLSGSVSPSVRQSQRICYSNTTYYHVPITKLHQYVAKCNAIMYKAIINEMSLYCIGMVFYWEQSRLLGRTFIVCDPCITGRKLCREDTILRGKKDQFVCGL